MILIKKKIFFYYFILFVTQLNAQTIYYVDSSKEDNLGNGLTWATAKKDIQNAINSANSGDEIWVKTGTYKPTHEPNGGTVSPRNRSFFIRNGVKLFGGFNGNETTFNQRNFTNNPTILSGDIGIEGNPNDNCHHVVLAATTQNNPVGILLDGFTITGGNSDGSSNYYIIEGNDITSNLGGGIFIYNGNNVIRNNIINNNRAITGAGICIKRGINEISNNTISGNLAFDISYAQGSGGGIYVESGISNIYNCTFLNNTATNGGGIYEQYGTINATNNLFTNNIVSNAGGAAFVSEATFMILNNTLIRNKANCCGGAIYGIIGINTIINNVIASNESPNGGGIYMYFGENNIVNNTIFNNSASSNGGGIAIYVGLNKVRNNIFWDNLRGSSNNIVGSDYALPRFTGLFQNNSIQVSEAFYDYYFDNYVSKTGNKYSTNPLFLNSSDIDGEDNIHRTSDDGLNLNINSPLINLGINSYLPNEINTDITGRNRFQNDITDIGAYEYTTPCPNILIIPSGISTPGNFVAKNDFFSTATISNPTYYKSTRTITLLPGFSADFAKTFTANVGEGCNN